jgi:hypothetical protein
MRKILIRSTWHDTARFGADCKIGLCERRRGDTYLRNQTVPTSGDNGDGLFCYAADTRLALVNDPERVLDYQLSE